LLGVVFRALEFSRGLRARDLFGLLNPFLLPPFFPRSASLVDRNVGR